MTHFRKYAGTPDKATRDAGAEPYLASPTLATAVNTALAAGQPLLVTGPPGTGKSRLAESVADAICGENNVRRPGSVKKYHVRSDSKARDALYVYDNMERFFDAQNNNDKAKKLSGYRRLGALGEALMAKERSVVLIDEIDKAPPDFPNDLLNVIDRWEVDFPDTQEEAYVVPEALRPFVLITSNQERPLPHPFLRRCVFHHLQLPGENELRRIVSLHLGRESKGEAADPADEVGQLIDEAIVHFLSLRDQKKFEWEKPPSTGELLAWLRVLQSKKTSAPQLKKKDYWEGGRDHLGALVKTIDDWNRALKHLDEQRHRATAS